MMAPNVKSSLADKVVLLSGGNGVLLTLLVKKLAHLPLATFVHLKDRPDSGAQAMISDLAGAGYDVQLIGEVGIETAIAQVVARRGRIDIAVNIVETTCSETMLLGDESEMLRHAPSFHNFIKIVAPRIATGGNILTVHHHNGVDSDPLTEALGAFASPLEYFTRTAARELQPRQVGVSAINVADNSVPSADAVADLALFLLDEGRWISGQTLRFENQKPHIYALGRPLYVQED